MTLHNLPIFSEPPPLCEGKDLIFLAIALYITTSSTGVLGFSSQAWLPSWPHTAWEKVNRKLEQARRSICLKEWIKIDAMVVLIDLVFCQVKSEKKKKRKSNLPHWRGGWKAVSWKVECRNHIAKWRTAQTTLSLLSGACRPGGSFLVWHCAIQLNCCSANTFQLC